MNEANPVNTFNICVAVEENYGFGNNRRLPWPSIKADCRHYLWLTSRTKDPSKKVMNIKGRLTYEDSVVSTELNRPGVMNVIVSSTYKSCPKHACRVVPRIEEAMALLDTPPFAGQIETVWIMGGQRIYEEAIKSQRCHRIYLTHIFKSFKCDRFFPMFKAMGDYKEVKDPDIDGSIQQENGIKFQFQVYERLNNNS